MTRATTPDGETVTRLAQLLARPPQVAGVRLDPTYFQGWEGSTDQPRMILPAEHRWRASDEDGRPNIPLQLCEFLAYKTALAYNKPQEIESYLASCCAKTDRFRFFDSTTSGASGAAADAQGYGFVFEGKAFVVFRGTQSDKDWSINTSDSLTDELGRPGDRRYRELKTKYGDLVDRLGEPSPGRHVGFSIAWAALKDQVEDWLADALEAEGDHRVEGIVYAGHSLGGAMAQIAAYDHARTEERLRLKSRIVAVATFGAPAIGGTALAQDYRRLLGDRTVLLESSGDLVPRIMNRWYYRWLYPLRQRAAAGVQLHLQDNTGFQKVATPWQFASEPPLSPADLNNALREVASSLKNAAEEIDRQNARQNQRPPREKDGETDRGGDGGQAGKKADAAGQEAGGETPKLPSGKDGPNWAYWLVLGAVVVVAGGIAWYFVRRKLFAHDIEQRYALYLSTLSYQQLRASHAGNLGLANQALDEHLRFIRGDSHKSVELIGTPVFKSVQALPVRIDEREKDHDAFMKFLAHPQTFV